MSLHSTLNARHFWSLGITENATSSTLFYVTIPILISLVSSCPGPNMDSFVTILSARRNSGMFFSIILSFFANSLANPLSIITMNNSYFYSQAYTDVMLVQCSGKIQSPPLKIIYVVCSYILGCLLHSLSFLNWMSPQLMMATLISLDTSMTETGTSFLHV